MASYQAVAQRRLQYDMMMWQVPALGIAAQAFLLTVALGHDSSRLSRVLSSIVAGMIALLTMQLMAKHRWHERIDNQWLETFERRNGLEVVHQNRSSLAKELNLEGPGILARWRSYHVWQLALAIFGIVNLLCAIIALFAPQAFSDQRHSQGGLLQLLG
ncbi:hypothetical protein [Streptomyces sp. NPDC050485]|uniref:hypothetical protein n=1 Tax=Streptomyces sp. NPDC050485 TaxID=3365617 RepID=UPI0037A05C42